MDITLYIHHLTAVLCHILPLSTCLKYIWKLSNNTNILPCAFSLISLYHLPLLGTSDISIVFPSQKTSKAPAVLLFKICFKICRNEHVSKLLIKEEIKIMLTKLKPSAE